MREGDTLKYPFLFVWLGYFSFVWLIAERGLAMIQFKDINKIYAKKGKNNEIHAVRNVSFTVETGSICGIIGYSGAGKSTLLRMVNGLESPSSGEITVAGQVITDLRGKELRQARQKMGMIFQHFHLLWSRTVRENISFPLEVMKLSKMEIARKVDYLLERVDLVDQSNAYPAQLSGGQKQRVGIARAIAANPAVLLCDEATSALDPETTASILTLLREINRDLGITILLITHEMSVVRSICNQMVVMDQGEVVEIGNVSNLFKHPQHGLTKAFISSLNEPIASKKSYIASFNDQTTWSQLQQLLKTNQISLKIESSSTTSSNDRMFSFHLLGEYSQVKKAQQIIENGDWRVEVQQDPRPS